MTEHDCEQVLVSALALSEGETPVLPQAILERHLDTCDACRRELAAHEATGTLFKSALRKSFQRHLWPAIVLHLRPHGTRAGMTGVLGIAAVAACVLRGGILAWSPMLGWLGSAATIIVLSAAFLILRENPFSLPEGLLFAAAPSPEK
jgi:anti-sigma factor RsiW